MAFVITDECVSCGDCGTICDDNKIYAISMGNVHYEIDPGKCTSCGACVSVCQVGAIS